MRQAFFIVCIIFAIILYSIDTSYTKIIGGFYEADPEFCKEAGIDTFCMYIDNKMVKGKRSCYILMKSDDILVINEPSAISIKLNKSGGADSASYYNIEFDEFDSDINDIFPNKQQLRFYPNSGKIVLYKNDTIYGVMYKNGPNSEIGTDD